MKSFLQTFLVIIVGTALVVVVGRYYIIQQNRPCRHPIQYSIGDFSERFGITKTEFLTDLEQAATLWEVKAGKELFAYNDRGALKINLVYDQRQSSTEARQTLETKINIAKAELLSLPSRSDNQAVAEFNAKVSQLNEMIKTYNTIGNSVGEKFSEGQYLADAQGERIMIYQFSDKTKLVRLLTHELGHALGLDHVADSEAMMYELNDSASLKLTGSDILALKNLCEAK
jgi:hypothetical protein